MPSDLSTLNLATLSAAESAILAILRSKTCQWEQDADDAAATGNLSTALLLKHWADAADLLTLSVITEFSAIFSSAWILSCPKVPAYPCSICYQSIRHHNFQQQER